MRLFKKTVFFSHCEMTEWFGRTEDIAIVSSIWLDILQNESHLLSLGTEED